MKRISLLVALMAVVVFIATAEARAPYSSRGAAKIAQDEEFSGETALININNLAAVPSIVFGLLGMAVFLNFFSMPRSAPLVGGMVLALMTLPTIIIAARAALSRLSASAQSSVSGFSTRTGNPAAIEA